jgi:hypothetical protein
MSKELLSYIIVMFITGFLIGIMGNLMGSPSKNNIFIDAILFGIFMIFYPFYIIIYEIRNNRKK